MCCTSKRWQGEGTRSPGAWTLAGAQNVNSASPFVSTAVPGFSITDSGRRIAGYLPDSHRGRSAELYRPRCRHHASVRRRHVARVVEPRRRKSYYFGTTLLNRAYDGYIKYVTAAPKQLAGLYLPVPEFPEWA